MHVSKLDVAGSWVGLPRRFAPVCWLVLVASAGWCPVATAQVADDGEPLEDVLPPVVSEARDGADAEALLFEAAGLPYPSQVPLSYTYRYIPLATGPVYRVRYHANAVAQGLHSVLGDLEPLHTYATPNYALLQQSWSPFADELASTQAGFAAFRFTGLRGTIYGVVELSVGHPLDATSRGSLARIHIVETTADAATATQLAHTYALQKESECAGEWLEAGFPPVMLASAFNASHQPDPPTVSTPPVVFRLIEGGMPGPIGNAPIDNSCSFGASHQNPWEQFTLSIPISIRPVKNDFGVRIEIVCTGCGRLCVSGEPVWTHRIAHERQSRASSAQGYFEARIDSHGDAHYPCGAQGFLDDSWVRNVMWTVEYRRPYPLDMRLDIVVFDPNSVPSTVLWEKGFICGAMVCCGQCCP